MTRKANRTGAVRAAEVHVDQMTTHEELNALVSAIKRRWREISADRAAEFKLGQKVQFNPGKGGADITGTVKRINEKTVTVRTSFGADWRIPPSMLRVVA